MLVALLAATAAGCGDTMSPTTTTVSSTPGDVLEPAPPAAEALAAPAAEAAPTSPASATEAPTLTTPAETPAEPPAAAAPASAPPSSATPPAAAVALVPMSYDEYRVKAATRSDAKLTVVDAWATWCGPCKENFPHLVEMHRKYAGKGLNVVSLSMDDATDQNAVAEATKFLNEQGATFTNVLLNEDFGVGFERFGINAIPAVFLYGPDGKELRRFTGDDTRNQFTYEQVDEIVALLLEGKPLPENAPGIAPPATTP